MLPEWWHGFESWINVKTFSKSTLKQYINSEPELVCLSALPDASTYAHFLFNAFDTDHNGSVSFEVSPSADDIQSLLRLYKPFGWWWYFGFCLCNVLFFGLEASMGSFGHWTSKFPWSCSCLNFASQWVLAICYIHEGAMDYLNVGSIGKWTMLILLPDLPAALSLG